MFKLRSESLHIRLGRVNIVVNWSRDTRRGLWAKGIWLTGNGLKIPVEEMDTSHLINAAGMLARQAWTEAQQTECIGGIFMGMIDDREQAEILLATHPAWPHLLDELEKRHVLDIVTIPWRD